MLKTSRDVATATEQDMLDFVVNQLIDIFILCILRGEPQTGYGVKMILNRTLGVKVSYGVLYPRLHNLENLGYIAGSWVPHSKIMSMKKKIYTATDAGKAALEAYTRILRRAFLTLQIGFSSRNASVPTDVQSAIQPLVKMLERKGYIVREGVELLGKTGSEHRFDIFALKYSKGVEEKMVYGVYTSKDEVGVEAVLDLCAKTSDVGVDQVIILAIPKLSSRAVELTKLCKFLVYEASEVKEAVQKLLSDEELVVNISRSIP